MGKRAPLERHSQHVSIPVRTAPVVSKNRLKWGRLATNGWSKRETSFKQCAIYYKKVTSTCDSSTPNHLGRFFALKWYCESKQRDTLSLGHLFIFWIFWSSETFAGRKLQQQFLHRSSTQTRRITTKPTATPIKKQHQQQQQPQQQQKEEEEQIEPHQGGNILRSDSKRLFRGDAAPSPSTPSAVFRFLLEKSLFSWTTLEGSVCTCCKRRCSIQDVYFKHLPFHNLNWLSTLSVLNHLLGCSIHFHRHLNNLLCNEVESSGGLFEEVLPWRCLGLTKNYTDDTKMATTMGMVLVLTRTG